LIIEIQRHLAGVLVGVLVGVNVGVGVGVMSQGNNNISSQLLASVAITKTSPNNSIPPNSGTWRVNVGGTETTPVITLLQ
jgi:hypothetical protein